MGYNDAVSKISINLTDVYDEATKMQTDLDSIETTWSGTMKQWDRLHVSWAGDTQPLVEAFLADINKVQDQIFGTGKPKDPSNPAGEQVLDKPGLYQQVKGVAIGATQNYTWTDHGVANMFKQLSADTTDTAVAGSAADGKGFTVNPSPDQTGDAPGWTGKYISETF